MSKRFGFLVVNQRTGYMQEGKDHAAKVFATPADARHACRPLSADSTVGISYESIAASLLKGSAFCFETEELHVKFLKCLRNDAGNKVFLPYSQNRSFVRWRKTDEKVNAKNSPGAGVAPDPAPQAPAASNMFNPDILLR